MADIVTSRVFTDGERGITAQKLNDIVGSSVIQPAFYTSKPTAGSADPADIALILKAGAYAQVPISTLAGSATQAQIWSTRLRSYNSVGNPSFEVDQRNVGGALVNPSNGAFLQDRWSVSRTGTMAINTQQVNLGISPNLVVPGTSFQISKNYLSSVLSTQQASLGAGDVWQLQQIVEGPTLRELVSDVTSFSLLVSSSVAGLKFSVAIRDSGPATKSLVKLCTIPTASTWTLIQLPNLPVFPSGNFSLNPGAVGYVINICLAAGSTWMAPAADTWQNGSFTGAPGMSNFANSPVNSVFQVAFLQHEPGAVCSTFIDKPFVQNYDECLRYYQKSYDYGVGPSVASTSGSVALFQCTTTSCFGAIRFNKPMAKIPAVSIFNPVAGGGGAYYLTSGVNYGVSAATSIGTTGFQGVNTATMPAPAAGTGIQVHYVADTGW